MPLSTLVYKCNAGAVYPAMDHRRSYQFYHNTISCHFGGDASYKFCKEPLRGNNFLFCGRGLKLFSPLRGSNSSTTLFLEFFFFFGGGGGGANTQKSTTKALVVDLSRMQESIPKRYNKHVPPPLGSHLEVANEPSALPTLQFISTLLKSVTEWTNSHICLVCIILSYPRSLPYG